VLDLLFNDLTRNEGLFVSSFLERFLDRSEFHHSMADPFLHPRMKRPNESIDASLDSHSDK
jgi:hypothetical protein